MSKTKYIISGGLAFSEFKDMMKLRNYSLKGWHVSRFSMMGYTLEKGEEKDYIYSIDYRLLQTDEEEEYIDFFSSAGWEHVTSEGDIHLFRADPGTRPIYTDRDTTIEKYKNSSSSMVRLTVPLLLFASLGWLGGTFTTGTLQSILHILASIFIVLLIPIGWTLMTTYKNKWKVAGKRTLAHLTEIIPFALLLPALFILFIGRGTGALAIILSGLIGGVGLPTLIWIFMVIRHKVRG